jgi:diaminopropionate ammonia-lyase
MIPNPSRGDDIPPDGPGPSPLVFHESVYGYAPTPLIELPEVARSLGLSTLWVKVESSRFGLPAFKILGASWAAYRELRRLVGAESEPVGGFAPLVRRIAATGIKRLVASTEGNHGRAVARVASWLDLDATILVPRGTARERVEAIRGERAEVVEVNGSYDDTVERARDLAEEGCLLIQDTAWPGYERIPRWVVQGYATMFHEIDRQLEHDRRAGPTLVLVQAGVGSLASAVVIHYRASGRSASPVILSVEPVDAAGVQASIRAGLPVEVPGPHRSIMAGLNCGRISSLAWPVLSAGLDGALTIEDRHAERAVCELAAANVSAGASGAAGLAGLLGLRELVAAGQSEERSGLEKPSRVLVFCTEGITDRAAHDRILARGNSR